MAERQVSRVPSRAVGEPRLAIAILFLVFAVAVGVGTGAAVTIRRGAVYEASALLDITATDDVVSSLASGATDTGGYVQSQIASLAAIAAGSAGANASLSIRQDGSTALVH